MIYNRPLEDDYLKFKNDRDNLIPFLLGRNAINHLIKTLNIKAILLPTYICSMVIDIFKHYEIEIFFYENLNKKLEVPLQNIINRVEKVNSEKKIFFLWHDYLNIIGDIPDLLYEYLEKSNIETIIDATHSLPIKNYRSQNVVYGFRKLLNQPMGALLKVDIQHKHLLGELSFGKLWKFILFHRFIVLIYKIFRKSNRSSINRILKTISAFGDFLSFDKHNFFLYDDFSYKKILDQHSSLDYEKISKKRNKNFMMYHKVFPGKIKIENYDIDCPFGFPLIVNNNKIIRKKLWDLGVHSFILWEDLHEDVSTQVSEESNLLSCSNLILPVNQDLSSNDIHKIIEILNG
jgi:hypothetical protein